MKSKKIKVGALAMALVFAMSGSAFAVTSGGPSGGVGGVGQPTPDEYAHNADTTISIFESSQNAGNMSYTIPLYVTMAVSKGKAEVAVPDTYGITNNSKIDQGSTDKMEIGVTGVTFEKLKGSTYNTVAATPTTKDDILLSIGGVTMPALSDPKSEDLALATIYGTGSEFGTGGATGKPKAIPPSPALYPLHLKGTVAEGTGIDRTDKDAVAQFRVKYQVALLKTNGDPINGKVYSGSNWQQAGLKNWDENAPTTPAGN